MQNEPTTIKNLITDFELNELMAKIIDHCFNRWNEKELLIANRIKQFVADFLERKLANELDSANEQARADERQKVLSVLEGWLVDEPYSRQAQMIIDRRNSDPMCKTPYPIEAKWKDERNRFRAELRAKLAEMKK